MKNAIATALALLITGCAQQTFTVQNKPAAVALKETITYHFLFLELAEEKLSMQPKFVAAQKMLLKQKTQQKTFVNGLLGLYYFRHLYPLEARVYCLLLILHELPIDMGNSYPHCLA